ncbi:MAG TPA: D-alanyl-D-alanine carboxypeptidase, partial [Sphingomicrobium sp.]
MTRAFLFASATAILFAGAAPAKAPPYESPAKTAFLIDLSSGAVLYSKDPDLRIPPASMAKMMTTNVAFELIKKGDLQLSKMCTVRPET